MLINRVFPQYTPQVNFKSGINPPGHVENVVRNHTTRIFRDDFDWKKFANFIADKYKFASKVNIIDCACSNGSESLSLAVVLSNALGGYNSKIFPILATDIDKDIIAKANNKKIPVSDYDLYAIHAVTGKNYSEWFIPHPSFSYAANLILEPKDELRNSVRFKNLDVFESLKYLSPENNILFLRNFWKYMSEADQVKLAKLLFEKLDSTSLVVIGELERGNGQNKLLESFGFKECSVFGVYQKQ